MVLTPMTDDSAIRAADDRFTEWMRLNLDRAAEHFDLRITGRPVLGWRLRSIGATVTAGDQPRWLRVVSDFPQWAHGETWTGNLDANTVTGIAKPRLLDVYEWDEQDWRRQRAEVLTLLPGDPVAPTSHLSEAVHQPDSWWGQLRQTIDTLRTVPTTRTNCTPDTLARRTQETYGTALSTPRWETIHGDLHWQNLLTPQFGLLDWELWGSGPAGTDAATLLLYSLAVPEVFGRVYETFADQLDTDAGRTAQLWAAARLLKRIQGGDHPELEAPLRTYLKHIGVPSLRAASQVARNWSGGGK